MAENQDIKRRFGIIGNDKKLNRAIDKVVRVSPTDISVLITGESGVGKENLPKIIHQLSHRKHNSYIAVNCGAIPEGTIDSELFGHEKGAFTGATVARKGYFEVANGGTIFLDEIGELPLSTQVRLLRVLEVGEFLKVGSSKTQKTDVRIVTATNVDMLEAVKENKFREDLFYRLNTIEINLPPLRDRQGDIHLLFRKFAADFAEKYRMPVLRLDPEAITIIEKYSWPGNIRQLRNFVEQISVIEKSRFITPELLIHYLPESTKHNYPAISIKNSQKDFDAEKNMIYRVLFDLRAQIDDLKQLTMNLLNDTKDPIFYEENESLISRIFKSEKEGNNIAKSNALAKVQNTLPAINYNVKNDDFENKNIIDIEESENLLIAEKEKELIKTALDKHNGKRKDAAKELGISERTLYRKIKLFM